MDRWRGPPIRWAAGQAESGKIDNGIVSVHIAYVREQQHTLLDGELFLPRGGPSQSWNPDADDPWIADKRQRAQLPDEAVHRPKTQMALEQLDRARANGVAGRLAHDIERTQRRNQRARVSARRRRLRELAALGIDPEQLPLCDEWAL